MKQDGELSRQQIHNAAAFLDKKVPMYASVIGVLGILVIWEILCRLQWIPPLYLPSPIDIIRSGWEITVSGEVFEDVYTSLVRIIVGYVCGAALGISVGLILGFFRWMDAIFTPVVYSIYPIPKIALLPLIILWLGIGELPKIVIIALGVFFPVIINTYAGVRNIDPILIKVAITFGSSRLSIMRKVMLPASLPTIMAGLKLAAGTSLILLVSAEMIASEKGLGAMILHYGHLMMTDRLLFGVFILSLLGLLFNRSLVWLERKLLPWK